jgi:hypothetical protein
MRQLQVTPLDGYDAEIGRWLWALQDVRDRYTLRLIKDLDERLVDWEGISSLKARGNRMLAQTQKGQP